MSRSNYRRNTFSSPHFLLIFTFHDYISPLQRILFYLRRIFYLYFTEEMKPFWSYNVVFRWNLSVVSPLSIPYKYNQFYFISRRLLYSYIFTFLHYSITPPCNLVLAAISLEPELSPAGYACWTTASSSPRRWPPPRTPRCSPWAPSWT